MNPADSKTAAISRVLVIIMLLETRVARRAAAEAEGRSTAWTVSRTRAGGTSAAASAEVPRTATPAGSPRPRRVSRPSKSPRARDNRTFTVPIGRPSRRAASS